MASSKGKEPPIPHFLLIPFLAQGHMIPLMDIALLLAHRGAAVTFVTTPRNAARLRPSAHLSAASGLPIRLLELTFRCAEAGLPDDSENVDEIPTSNVNIKGFCSAIDLLQPELENFLCEKSLSSLPSCMIFDKFIVWAGETARRFNIPTLVFDGMSAFSLLCSYNVKKHGAHESAGVSDHDPFPIPDIPDDIQITRAQIPDLICTRPENEEYTRRMRDSESSAQGVVINSFEDLEKEYIDRYGDSIGKKIWVVGPVSLRSKEATDQAIRGKEAAITHERCRSWLDSRNSGSVIYACFGSLSTHSSSQMIEIALGLEASNRPFIWAIRSGQMSSEIDRWLSVQGFEERTSGRGLVIRGWAPQVFILSHPSTGGFVTHCGWNSTLEALSAGVPMATWPLFAEQFLNEKMVVDVLKVGVSVGAKKAFSWVGGGDGQQEVIGKEVVREAVEKLMDGGEEGEGRRRRARLLGEKARRALEGEGSSNASITNLLQAVNKFVVQNSREREELGISEAGVGG